MRGMSIERADESLFRATPSLTPCDLRCRGIRAQPRCPPSTTTLSLIIVFLFASFAIKKGRNVWASVWAPPLCNSAQVSHCPLDCQSVPLPIQTLENFTGTSDELSCRRIEATTTGNTLQKLIGSSILVFFSRKWDVG